MRAVFADPREADLAAGASQRPPRLGTRRLLRPVSKLGMYSKLPNSHHPTKGLGGYFVRQPKDEWNAYCLADCNNRNPGIPHTAPQGSLIVKNRPCSRHYSEEGSLAAVLPYPKASYSCVLGEASTKTYSSLANLMA